MIQLIMIQRIVSDHLIRLSGQYPVVTVTGPRQSGKTTLCRTLFKDKEYVNLESMALRKFAMADPRGFIAQFQDGAVLDEIQRAPELLSEIQVDVDETRKNGRFILTGSSNFGMMAKVSQSLAGRTALLRLLPFSYREIEQDFAALSQDEIIYRGLFPRIYDQGLNPSEAASFYVSTYIERDVRNLLNVKDIGSFEIFLRLCAGRTGQVMNMNALAGEIGVSHNTVKQWLSVLEASYIVKLVRPYQANLNKRLIKAPKLFFLDTGLACFLLGIQDAGQLATHPLRGALFETFAFSELAKARFNAALPDNIYFYRDQGGLEIDFVMDYGAECEAIEVKSARALHPDFFTSLRKFAALNPAVRKNYLLYGGESSVDYLGARALGWRELASAAPSGMSIT
jgi:predicted AAA+ superfamily ATPase